MNIDQLKQTPAGYPGILAGVRGKITDDIDPLMGTSPQKQLVVTHSVRHRCPLPEKRGRVLTIVSDLMVQKGVG